MATPITPDQLIKALKRMGQPYREYQGWRERGIWRTKRDGFEPRGITIHHTAGGLGKRSVEQYIADIIDGDPSVPDKAHAVIAPDGALWLNAAGRANHCVYYSQRAMDAILAGDLPTTGSVAWRGSLQNMNRHAYGVECIATGVPNAAQRATAVKWAAALALHHGWSGGETFGHGEVAQDRDWSDPGWDMGTFRRDVKALVKQVKESQAVGEKPKPAPSPAPKPAVKPAAKLTISPDEINAAIREDKPKSGRPVGPRGAKVKAVETSLSRVKTLGNSKRTYLASAYVDGHAGSTLEDAIKLFQRERSSARNPSGKIGPVELARLRQLDPKATWTAAPNAKKK